jgi:hypothetical protein
VASAALAGALDLIAGLGGGTIEGYPEAAGSVPAGFLFNGALSTYEKLGFVRDRKIGKHRWVVTRAVEPRSWRTRARTLAPVSSTSCSQQCSPDAGQGGLCRTGRRLQAPGNADAAGGNAAEAALPVRW